MFRILSQLSCCHSPLLSPMSPSLFPCHALLLSACQPRPPPHPFHVALSGFLCHELPCSLFSLRNHSYAHAFTPVFDSLAEVRNTLLTWQEQYELNQCVLNRKKTEVICLSPSSVPSCFPFQVWMWIDVSTAPQPPPTESANHLLSTGGWSPVDRPRVIIVVPGLRGMLLRFTTDVFSNPDKTTHRDEEKTLSLYSADPQCRDLWPVDDR